MREKPRAIKRGEVFGMRTVLGDAPPNRGRACVRVRCNCGQISSVVCGELLDGRRHSCHSCAAKARCVAKEQSKTAIIAGLVSELSALRAEVMALREENAKLKPCEYCGGMGDVHSLDGEWQGVCICAAGARIGQGT